MGIYGDLNLNGNTLSNCSINPDNCGVDGGRSVQKCLLISPNAINEDGTINKSGTMTVEIKNGFII